jgi:large subunit ribosomal protein L21
MSVVVEIAGTQYEVTNGETYNVPKLVGKPGDKLEFDKILFSGEGNDVKIGTPFIEGSVKAEIVEHGRDKKILIFHKKRRKGYRKLNGHKAQYTQIKITDIKA